MKQNDNNKTLLNFIAEIGQLKRVQRSGWWTCGIQQCESVAEHSFRCAIIGFILAQKEKADPYKTALMCLCNDVHEARLNDLHKVSQRYINLKDAEKRAFNEQVRHLPKKLKESLQIHMHELWADTSCEAQIARDADLLECMIQGKEYFDQGFKQTKNFFTKSVHLLHTKSAQALARSLKKWDSRDWIKNLVNLER